MKELLIKCGAYKYNEEEINFSKNYAGRYLVNDYFDHWFIGTYRAIWIRFTNLLSDGVLIAMTTKLVNTKNSP